MSFLYHTFFFDPLYNVLVLLFKILPWADAGIIVIILTILVRLIIFPLSRKAVVTQVKMAEIAPELAKIKEQYKDKAERKAKRPLALYKEKGANQFWGILVIFFQFKISMKGQTPPKGNSFGDNLTRSMQTQMKYFFPIIVFFISYNISGVIALYWLTTNLFSIGQELFVRRRLTQVVSK